MKPVSILRYARTEGPGHFATFLTAHRVPFRIVCLDENEPVPESSAGFAGLGFMGGPMSANDDYPWTLPVLALMRDALERGVPMIGHCLGGQMLARAMQGRVSRNPVKEIGWIPVMVESNAAAADWFGPAVRRFHAFEWHGDTFTIPPGATRVLTGEHCANQAFVFDDRHLAFQCHVEMTSEMVETWCGIGIEEIDENIGKSPAVQDALTIRTQMLEYLEPLSAVATKLYTRWIEKLAR